MNRIFHPYYLWEDVTNGILNSNYNEQEEEIFTNKAKQLLCNTDEFYNVGLQMLREWKYSAEQNLSNRARNRQAWIGQASCCFACQVPEHITKYAWRLMTEEEQSRANSVADKIINLWEKEYAKEILQYKCF